MKVIVIGFGKLYIMPYMHFYLDQLSKHNFEVHLVYWDRDGKMDVEIPDKVIAHRFDIHIDSEQSRWKKIPTFLRYRKMCKELIENGNFDFAVVLTTPPGILLLDIINKFFNKKYIFDYRDITIEKNRLLRKLVHHLVKHSMLTFVSSDGFRVHLPNIEIHTSHNILLSSLEHRGIRNSDSRNVDPIRIRYWGLIRHETINRKMIERFARDNRFELHYHGREDGIAQNLKAYAASLGADNVYFHGIYKPEDRFVFARQTDVLHNIFENDMATKPAMANKYYDGITFHIPQLCNLGSFMGRQIEVNGVGHECDPCAPSFVEDIYSYYHGIQWERFQNSCNVALDGVLGEYQRGVDAMNHAFERMAKG